MNRFMYSKGMPQVSRYRLDQSIQEEMFRRFWSSIANLKNPTAVSEFFSDLLTDTEEIMLAKRLTVAVLLLRGKRPIDIAQTLHVSFSMVGRVSTWVDRANPSTRRELERISREASWQKFIDTIEKLMDKLPPRYHTNWTQEGREKYRRLKERAKREELR